MPEPIAPAAPATESIPNTYDESGRQTVESGVLDFDDTPTPPSDDNPNPPADDTPPAPPADEPPKPPAEPAKPAPAAPQPPAEPVLILGKFKTEQDLKNAFIELGGDPAKFTDPKMLEEAYSVRESELSRSRATIKANTPPPAPPKTAQELLQEEFGGIDPNTFEGPKAMMDALLAGFGNVLGKFAEQNKQVAPLDPVEVDRNIKSLNALHDLETKVPRLKSDTKLRQALAGHIRQLRDDGKMFRTPDGYEDPAAAFRDMIQNQSAVVEEATKAMGIAKAGKDLSTAINNDGSSPNPASAPKKDAGDAIIDDLLGAKTERDRKYGN